MANREADSIFRPWEASTPNHTPTRSPIAQRSPSVRSSPKADSPSSSPSSRSTATNSPSTSPCQSSNPASGNNSPSTDQPSIRTSSTCASSFYNMPLTVPPSPFCYTFGFPWAGIQPVCSPIGNDSGYQSEQSPLDLSAKTRPQKQRRNLNPSAVASMERWYEVNRDHPYPSDEVVNLIARTGNITTAQVRKWMANKRVRSHNTLSYNQASLVRRGGRTRKELYPSLSPTDRAALRHTPYPLRQHLEASRSVMSYQAHHRGPLSLLASPVPCQTASPAVPYTQDFTQSTAMYNNRTDSTSIRLPLV